MSSVGLSLPTELPAARAETMGRMCAMPNCGNRMKKTSPLSFHQLPLQDRGRLNLWLAVLGMDVETPLDMLRSADHRVCSDHFERDDYFLPSPERKRPPQRFHLNQRAVPSLHRRLSAPDVGLGDGVAEVEVSVPESSDTTSSKVPVLPYIVINSAAQLILQLQGQTLTTPVIYRRPIGEQPHRNQSHIQPIGIQQAEVQQLSVCKEELPPEQQEWSPSLGQEEPEPPHIKEEEEEFPVKREHDEECAQWSQLHQWQTEEKREAEPVASTSTEQMETEVDPEDTAAALEPSGAEQLLSSHCSEPETEDGDGGWEETTEPPSGVKSQSAQTRSSFSSQLFLHKHIKRSHSELYVQQLRSGEIRAESLLPSVTCQLVRTSGTTQRQNPAPGMYSCDQCGKTFHKVSYLKAHQRIHSGERPHGCGQCGKSFNTKGELRRHERVHSGEKPHRCPQCAVSFSQRCSLVEHQRIHSGEKPHHCPLCDKRFNTKSHLTVHQRSHTGEKPYRCQPCGKSFVIKSHLNAHQCGGAAERPHLCPRCGESFPAAPQLKEHQRTHAAEKTHGCTRCGKTFRRNSDLRIHERVHTGARPYRCARCGRSFTQACNLKRHHSCCSGATELLTRSGSNQGPSDVLTRSERTHREVELFDFHGVPPLCSLSCD